MAEREIKTKLTLDGEKEFRRGIKSINNELSLGNTMLKEVAATYDLNGDRQAALASKSKILREQLDAQNRKVDELTNRLRQAEQATDLSADGMTRYRRDLIEATTAAKRIQKQLNDTDRELEELGRDSRRAGDQLERNLGESAEDVENKFERMAKGIKESLEDVRGLQSISLGVDLVRGAWDIGENIASFVEQIVNENLKRAMVSYNITSAGGNLAASMGVANEYAAIFQDQESAYEAVSNIVAAGYNDADLRRMAQYIGGAAIQFQDTLKIESLADSLQETLSTGKLTGQLGELVSRLEAQTGITEEQVNLQLAEARKQDEATGGNVQTMLALEAYLKNSGLAEYYEGFKEQNKELVEAATNLQEFNTALNELAETTLPLLTPAIEWLTTAIETAAEAIDTVIKWFRKNNPVDVVEEALPDPTPGNEGVAQEKSKLEQWGAIIAQGATGGTQWFDMTNEMYGVGLPALIQNTQTPKGQTRAEQNRADYLKYVESENNYNESEYQAEEATTTVTNILQNFAEKVVASMQAEADRLKYLTEVEIQSNYNEGVLETYDAEMGTWTPVEDVQEKVDAAEDAARTGGTNIGTSLVTGLDSATARLRAVAEAQRLTLEDVWADPITPTVVIGYKTAGPVNPALPEVKVTVQPADVNLDGRKVGTVVSSWVNSVWGKLINGQ